jgi:hypothetical protein
MPAQAAGNAMKKYAAAAVKRGLRVFPLRSNDKRPAHTGWQSEVTSDEEQALVLWNKSTANIGVATGSGILVIDIDVKHGNGLQTFADLENTHGPTPKTLTVATPSGGQHRYFKVPADLPLKNSAGRLGRDIDTRANGGYVVGPGSKINGKKYEVTDPAPIADLPPNWLALLTDRPKPEPRQKLEQRDICGATPYGKAALQREAETVSCAVEGTRNHTLNIAALKIGSLVAGGELEEDASRAELMAAAGIAGLSEGEASATIASGMAAGKKEPRQAPPRAEPAPSAEYEPPPCDEQFTAAPDQKEPLPLWEASIKMDTDDKGRQYPAATAGNAALYLAHLDEWHQVLAQDDLTGQVVWSGSPPQIPGMTPPRKGDDFKESDLVYVGHWFARFKFVKFKKEILHDAIPAAAVEHRINTMVQYYRGLEWDGIERLGYWLTAYLGVERTVYSETVGRWWLVSVVARALQPGCQVDHMLVLEGPQGRGKSRAIRILGGQWALGSLPDIRDKDAAQCIFGKGIVEISELDAIRGAAITRIKDFLTQQWDVYRPSYGHYVVRRPRTAVFIGTTNEIGYLTDTTGARRFWPVLCCQIDLDALERDRDQLFAEAVHTYSNGAQWWPDVDAQPMLAEQQEARAHHDAWEEPILAFMAMQLVPPTVGQIAELSGLKLDMAHLGRAEQSRIGAILRKAGYVSVQKRTGEGKIRVYQKP